ncbi:DNA mismatch repair ATPase msh1 [Actinomortierella ambigua]|nr:DNA mismatch repair ATPase msh1 [Actinomortierella ambigua]
MLPCQCTQLGSVSTRIIHWTRARVVSAQYSQPSSYSWKVLVASATARPRPKPRRTDPLPSCRTYSSSSPDNRRKRSPKPKETILSLDDLLSTNPNPALTSATRPPRAAADGIKSPICISGQVVELLPSLEDIYASTRRSRKTAGDKDHPLPSPSPPKATPKQKTAARMTPLQRQIREFEEAYPDCVLLVRVGEFYELYDHNATEYGHLLGLKMGQKSFSGKTIPFTGFPIRQLDRHLETLVGRHHLKVALCEQFQDEGSARTFRRSVHRIITPGTLIDEQFLDQTENNWLLAVTTDLTSHSLGLSWLDLSTGDFFTQETTYESFPNDLTRIRPREIIVNSNLRNEPSHPVLQTIQNLGPFVVSFEDMRSAAQLALHNEHPILNEAAEAQLGFDRASLAAFTNREQSACLVILRYIHHTQMGRRPFVQQPILWEDSALVKMDRNTIQALELVRTLRDSSRIGSLLHYLDHTKTKAGSRLLANWLNMVEFFTQDTHLIYEMDTLLSECRDAQRAVQKLSLGQCNDPQDLISIRITLEALQRIKARMSDKIQTVQAQLQYPVPGMVRTMTDSIHEMDHLCELIRNVVDESIIGHEGDQGYGFINASVSPELNELHAKLSDLKRQKKQLLEKWTTHLGGVRPFEIKSSFGYRHVVEMRSTIAAEKLRELVDQQVLDVSHADQRRTKVRYQVPILTNLLDSIERLEFQIVQQERSILSATRAEILEDSAEILANCQTMAQLDVLLCFAKLALQHSYVRPQLNGSNLTRIRRGRHPVVEQALQQQHHQHFVDNDCHVGEDNGQRIWLITGPNMGGKSTFLRQNAILTIMAQMGSFIPVESAELGIVDRVFSRLGGADNLANAQSTFMVEMTETASILQQATPNSLVIMDEVGRGTATLDGCAIAFATLHHLYHVNKCRTLFATHYHELADMAARWQGETLDGVACYQTVLQDASNGHSQPYLVGNHEGEQQEQQQSQPPRFVYAHKVIPGVCRQSHGIHVARLAAPREVRRE